MITVYPINSKSGGIVGSMVAGPPAGPPIINTSTIRTGVLTLASNIPALVSANNGFYNEPYAPVALPSTAPTFNVFAASPTAFVNISSGGLITTSSDLVTWTGRTTAQAISHVGLIYKNNKFLAWTGATGALATRYQSSADNGVTWTAGTGANTYLIRDVCWGTGGPYIAAGNNGSLEKSTDMITWTSITSGTTQNLYAVSTNSSGTYVAVGDNGTILVSVDGGVTWASKANPLSGMADGLRRIVWAGTQFVAASAGGQCLISPTGITWQLISAIIPVTLTGNLVDYQAGYYVLDNGTKSTDLIAWEWKNGAAINTYKRSSVVFLGNEYRASITNSAYLAVKMTGYVGYSQPLTEPTNNCPKYIVGA